MMEKNLHNVQLAEAKAVLDTLNKLYLEQLFKKGLVKIAMELGK